MDWTPTISELSGPRYQRIVEAMEADIAAGRLVRGQQLPTQRALAKALGIDLTTVTRAYTEARPYLLHSAAREPARPDGVGDDL